jgi:hypothetical protein
MEEIELFPIPSKSFSSTMDFLEYLRGHYASESVTHPLTVVVGLTERNKPDLLSSLGKAGFKVMRELGEVIHLKAEIEKDQFLECYMTLDPVTGVVLFFTNFRKTEEIPKLNDFLEADPHSYYLFFPPLLLKRYIERLMSEHEDIEIKEFTSRRSPESRMPSRYRPSFKRTIGYWGDDGKETLKELEYAYGVLAQRVIFEIPSVCKFGIDCRGFMTFHAGDISCPLQILQGMTAEARRARSAYQTSSYKVVSAGTSESPLSIGLSSPVTILLKNNLTYDRVEELRSRLESEGFSIIDTVALEGSLFLSSDIISRAGHRYRIKSDGSKIRMFPDSERNLHSFMELYEFIVNQVDPDAFLEA